MKKQISKFLFIASILGALFLPNLSFASTLLKIESLGSTSVKLKAVGLSLNQEVRFTLKNNSTSIADYSKTVDTKNVDTSGAGSAVASFTDLVANGQYLAMVSDLNTGSVLKTLNFIFIPPKTSSSSTDGVSSAATPSAGASGQTQNLTPVSPEPVAFLSTSDITTTSITINASNLIANAKYEFKVSGDTIAPVKKNVVASDKGTASVGFSDFKASRTDNPLNYTATVSKYDANGYPSSVVGTLGFIVPIEDTSNIEASSDLGVVQNDINVLSNQNNQSNQSNQNSINNVGRTSSSNKLIPCGDRTPVVTGADGKQTGGEITNPCGFTDLLIMINRVIHYILFVLVVPIAAILFVYAGFMLITSGGEVGKKKKALSVFWNVGLGLIIAVAAWLIISTVLTIVGYDGSWIGF